MNLGIFAKTFTRSSVEQVLEAVAISGFNSLQFNFACAGLPTVPEPIQPELIQRIQSSLRKTSLTMAALSGTCNLIHPDPKIRAECLARLNYLVSISPQLAAPIVSLCTGTRDPADMWRAHPDNNSTQAWRDLLVSLECILPTAEEYQILLGIEPEPANVINSATSARKLLDELQSPALKIIFDAANLVAVHPAAQHDSILDEATDLLGTDIVLAHAKDLQNLDCSHYLPLLEKIGFRGSVILHGVTELEVPAAAAFLRARLALLRFRDGGPRRRPQRKIS